MRLYRDARSAKHQNFHACAANPHKIATVKNTFAKTVYYVTEYIIVCNLEICFWEITQRTVVITYPGDGTDSTRYYIPSVHNNINIVI